ncbi:hypothetical protein [Actinomadura mexicana]|uniref:hypothetical protein n=1 Tax=Actinomadura mexicana TaxID=134959 RepID=UPI0015C65775|nr:hypothetical protein [Actinomadura mexicana]
MHGADPEHPGGPHVLLAVVHEHHLAPGRPEPAGRRLHRLGQQSAPTGGDALITPA